MSAPDARTRTRRIAAGILLALLLAACGSATTSEGGVAFPSPSADPETTAADASTEAADAQSTTSPELIDPTEAPSLDPDTPVSSPPGAGTSAGMCAPDTPDCVDMIVETEHCPPEGCTGEPDIVYEETPIVPTRGTPRPVPFESAEPSADGTEVVVRWWSGVPPCTALADVEVIEDDDSITITLLEASEHPDDAEVACIAIAQAKQHTVQLAAPVGDREIIDGAA